MEDITDMEITDMDIMHLSITNLYIMHLYIMTEDITDIMTEDITDIMGVDIMVAGIITDITDANLGSIRLTAQKLAS